jgi:phosphate transport system permease protein
MTNTLLRREKLTGKDSALGREEGIPWIWVTGGALITVLVMIVALIGYIFSMGAVALWPRDVLVIQESLPSTSGSDGAMIGTFQRRLLDARTAEGGVEGSEDPYAADAQGEPALNIVYQGNRDLGAREFVYVTDSQIENAQRPVDLWYIERREWGPFIGFVKDLRTEDLLEAVDLGAERLQEILRFEQTYVRPVNRGREALRLKMARHQRLVTEGVPVGKTAWTDLVEEDAALSRSYDEYTTRLAQMRQEDDGFVLTLISHSGVEKSIPVSQISRAFQPNQLSWFGKIRVYADRVVEFLTENPREANTQGGVYPAIFGTVVMTLIMTVVVLPVGVMAAIYMREIASQGFLVSVVRVAVGNLAGVPSIVYGIFGLGFFCYGIGASIDELLFQDNLPSPTFGTGGVLWASLTLALLTLPVVIVSTEEALQAVPRSLREGSYGCGATRLQTLLRIVVPRAMPGVMTGMILAMARGMGEVAPLLVTGVVKLAPQLPIDGDFPFFHLERSFMHLGFHIYDVGFQSRSAELSRPMVFASTGLLVGLVFVLNLVAIRVRSQLRRRFEGRGAF